VSTYADRMRETQLDRERDNTLRQIAQKKREARGLLSLNTRQTTNWRTKSLASV
jgi:hypothetical protein